MKIKSKLIHLNLSYGANLLPYKGSWYNKGNPRGIQTSLFEIVLIKLLSIGTSYRK